MSSSVEIITLVITLVCLVCFCTVFTILFGHYYKSNIEAVSSGKKDIALIDNAVDEEKEKRSKAKKAWKIVGKVASYVVLGAVFAVFACSLVSKINDDVMPFGDTSLIAIASGSMSERTSDAVTSHPELDNQFDKYDLIGISKVHSPDDLALYDVVAYKNKDDLTIVHRIVEIRSLGSGETVYVTQGDSNKTNDAGSQYADYLTFDRIVGKYNGTRLKGIGVFVFFLQSPSGIVSVLSVIYCIFMFDHYSSKYAKAIVERTNMLVELIDYDLDNPEGDPLEGKYKESLVYRGSTYHFEDGKYLGKVGNGIVEEVYEDYMVFVKKDESGNAVTVTNTATNESRVFENVPEEDLSDLKKFLSLVQDEEANHTQEE